MKGLLELQKNNLGVAQGLALCNLHRYPSSRPYEVAQRLGLSLTRSSTLLITLLKKKYVTVSHKSSSDPKFTRGVYPHYTLTQKGLDLATLFN